MYVSLARSHRDSVDFFDTSVHRRIEFRCVMPTRAPQITSTMTLSFAALRTAPLRRLVAHYYTSSPCLATRQVFLVTSASFLMASLKSSQTTCAPNKSPPPRFGMSIRFKHHGATAASDGANSLSSINTTTEEEEDCPICRKYSQGPCGSLFQEWLKCTEANRGVDPKTQEELHLSKCSHLAAPLGECLETNKYFYDNLNIYDEVQEEEALLTEWTSVVREVEEQQQSDKEPLDFPPSLAPDLQIRPSTNTGMAAFVYRDTENKKVLTLAYVKDAETGQLLAAGSLQDLWEWQDKYGVLRLLIPPRTTTIVACALYDDVLYSKTQRVPPKQESKE